MTTDSPTQTEDSAGYWAMRRTCGAVHDTRDVISAAGEETITFLQGQLSQDLAAMSDGESQWSLLLKPQGKVDAWLRITRRSEDAWLLDVDAGFGEQVVTRLRRFLLRTKCEITQLDWQSVSVRGPSTSTALVTAEVLVSDDRSGVPGIDAFGPSVTVDDIVVAATPQDFDTLRIEAGIPGMGRELTEDTIPQAAGIVEASVSFTKGCYTGQELVARIDSRGGNVPQRLRSVAVTGEQASDPGLVADQELLGADTGDGASKVGRITSWAWSPQQECVVGLAYVSRNVDVPSTASIETPDGPISVTLAQLPAIA